MSRGKPPGMPRSNFRGFRYKRIMDHYVGETPEDQNRILTEEFENIAAGMEALRAAGEGDAEAVRSALSGGAPGGDDTNTDREVALIDADGYPDVLLQKMVAGEGILFTIRTPGRRGGPFVQISTRGEEMITNTINFNTYLDADGNLLAPDDPLRLQITFLHEIPHEHFLFDMYRPVETKQQPDTEDYHSDGTERGRFQIRWKNIERKANRLTVWLHQPEFGTCVIYGSRAVRSGQVHRVLVD